MLCSVPPGLKDAATTIICVVQPADWRIYLTPLLVLGSAAIAYLAMLTTRRVARQRATLDLIEKVESGDHYRTVVQTFTELRRGKGFAHLSNPKTDADKKARRCIFDFLNHYEMVSIGIRKGILDEAFYRDWMRGPFVRDWNAIALFVQRERWKREDGIWKYYDLTFIEFELLARAWSNEAISLSRLLSGPPPDDEADAPSAEPLPAPKNTESAAQQDEKGGPPQRALGVDEVPGDPDGSADAR